MRFRPEQHLRRPSEFRVVREQGRRLPARVFTLWWLPRPEGSLRRLGVVASTAAVGGAVLRSRAKRRLREVFRRHQELLPAGGDLILSARSALNRDSFAALEQEFAGACRKLSSVPHA